MINKLGYLFNSFKFRRIFNFNYVLLSLKLEMWIKCGLNMIFSLNLLFVA